MANPDKQPDELSIHDYRETYEESLGGGGGRLERGETLEVPKPGQMIGMPSKEDVISEARARLAAIQEREGSGEGPVPETFYASPAHIEDQRRNASQN